VFHRQYFAIAISTLSMQMCSVTSRVLEAPLALYYISSPSICSHGVVPAMSARRALTLSAVSGCLYPLVKCCHSICEYAKWGVQQTCGLLIGLSISPLQLGKWLAKQVEISLFWSNHIVRARFCTPCTWEYRSSRHLPIRLALISTSVLTTETPIIAKEIGHHYSSLQPIVATG
jgi:hypothetical protein